MKKKGVITQTSVHVKLDNVVLPSLTAYCQLHGVKKNRAINDILRNYLYYKPFENAKI